MSHPRDTSFPRRMSDGLTIVIVMLMGFALMTGAFYLYEFGDDLARIVFGPSQR